MAGLSNSVVIFMLSQVTLKNETFNDSYFLLFWLKEGKVARSLRLYIIEGALINSLFDAMSTFFFFSQL